MRIHVLSSDATIYSVEMLQHFINKYWNPNPEVVILGYKKPEWKMAKNFKFKSMGIDDGIQTVMPKIIKYFKNIPDKHVIFTIDDMIPYQPVDNTILDKLKECLLTSDAKCIKLSNELFKWHTDGTTGMKEYIHNKEEHNKSQSLPGKKILSRLIYHDKKFKYGISEVDQESKSRATSIWSMWDREYLLQKLEMETGNLWHWEQANTAQNDGNQILTPVQAVPVHCIHLFKRACLKSNWRKDAVPGKNTPGLNEEDEKWSVEFLESHGFKTNNHIPKRTRPKFLSQLKNNTQKYISNEDLRKEFIADFNIHPMFRKFDVGQLNNTVINESLINKRK